MRNEGDIESVADKLATPNRHLDWQGDNFKYGYYIGKLVALGWVLGEPSADMSIDHDFESWILEQRSHRGQIPPLKE
jgi:hypothetical protein